MLRLALIMLVVLIRPADAQSWDVALYDPAAAAGAPADLVLPLPCDGGIAFQRVAVQVEADNPLADRRIRVGQPQADTGFSDYLRTAYLRGAFPGQTTGETVFYIARYELTVGQYRALNGDCAPSTRRDRTAQGGLSWFEAVALSQRYSEWLLANGRDALPAAAERFAYLRLPTEVEWEYAVRGGAAIDPAAFPSRRFFGDGDMRDFAKVVGTARGKLLPVGLAQANPLGLFDVYGNAEELMLEPFQLNAVGRDHGQVGGLVTRGGSVLSTPEQVYSAQRTEYPLFRSEDGAALAADTFGLRLVLTRQVTTDDAALRDIQSSWVSAAESNEVSQDTPLGTLAALIAEEGDPRRQASLTALQLEFRRAREEAIAAFGEAVKSTLLNGAVIVGAMTDTAREIESLRGSMFTLADQLRICTTQCTALGQTANRLSAQIEKLRALQQTYLVSVRSALETLSGGEQANLVDQVSALLEGELTTSQQDQILQNFRRFKTIYRAYQAQPDMNQSALSSLVTGQ